MLYEDRWHFGYAIAERGHVRVFHLDHVGPPRLRHLANQAAQAL